MTSYTYLILLILLRKGLTLIGSGERCQRQQNLTEKKKIQKYVGFINIKHSYCEI